MLIGVDADITDRTIPITDLAPGIEDAGLDSLFVTQRIHVPSSRADLLNEEGHEMDASTFDPFVALAAAATVTSRISIGTGACYAALYDPLILAKQVSTLDHVSQGRMIFGITPGWLEEEVKNHGVEPTERWDVMREKVLAMKALWTGQDVGFHGTYVAFAPVRIGLRPVQKPHPPILVGSHGSRGLRHVVEYGDEWFPIVGRSTDVHSLLAQLARRCADAGRKPLPVTASSGSSTRRYSSAAPRAASTAASSTYTRLVRMQARASSNAPPCWPLGSLGNCEEPPATGRLRGDHSRGSAHRQRSAKATPRSRRLT